MTAQEGLPSPLTQGLAFQTGAGKCVWAGAAPGASGVPWQIQIWAPKPGRDFLPWGCENSEGLRLSKAN